MVRVVLLEQPLVAGSAGGWCVLMMGNISSPVNANGEINVTTGTRLREERERLGLSQPKLAELLNTTKKTVFSWESGRTAPDAFVLEKLAEAGMDLTYLLTGVRITNVVISGMETINNMPAEAALTVPEHWLPDGLTHRHLFWQRVNHDDMAPTLKVGDYLVVRALVCRDGDTIRHGLAATPEKPGIYMVRLGKSTVIRRVDPLPDGVRLSADNPLYGTTELRGADADALIYEGEVIRRFGAV